MKLPDILNQIPLEFRSCIKKSSGDDFFCPVDYGSGCHHQWLDGHIGTYAGFSFYGFGETK